MMTAPHLWLRPDYVRYCWAMKIPFLSSRIHFYFVKIRLFDFKVNLWYFLVVICPHSWAMRTAFSSFTVAPRYARGSVNG